ncbi:MAG: (2Fe-2S)-binding protein [Candidatus Angelobacter sp. Gp1-AA117]|nr:MAG: (2Fe-2S)-binding protein [Candidatus Angelobacter sp. Gp1-AA117]
MQSEGTLVKVTNKSSLPACGRAKEFMAGGRFICIANVNGEICATDNVCPHWGGPLGQGRIEDGKLICPWHGWQFDLRTGETPRKAGIRLAIYKVTVIEEDIFLAL